MLDLGWQLEAHWISCRAAIFWYQHRFVCRSSASLAQKCISSRSGEIVESILHTSFTIRKFESNLIILSQSHSRGCGGKHQSTCKISTVENLTEGSSSYRFYNWWWKSISLWLIKTDWRSICVSFIVSLCTYIPNFKSSQIILHKTHWLETIKGFLTELFYLLDKFPDY